MSQPTFRALADPTRRDILMLLRDGDMTIAEVAANFDMTRAAVKKHLTVLTEGGLITTRSKGRERFNSLNLEGMSPVRDWLTFFDAFWDDKLANLKSAIEKDAAMTATLQKTIYLKATKETVWGYLTDPEKLAIWFHKPPAELKAGESYEMFGTTSGDKLMWGDVIKADPHDYLEYTFTIGPMGDAASTVKWTLSDVAGGTQLSLLHEGLPQGEDAFGLILALDKGWDGHLDRMRTDIHDA